MLILSFCFVLARRYPQISDVRGLGLMVAIEFDPKTTKPGISGRLSQACLKRGMFLLKYALRIMPPSIRKEAQRCLRLQHPTEENGLMSY
jgi:4-aminobutyrate aminotransferase-like enzyme